MGNGERNIMGAGLQLRWIDEPEALQLLRSLFPIPAFAFAANRPTIPRQRGASCARHSLSISRVAATPCSICTSCRDPRIQPNARTGAAHLAADLPLRVVP